MDLLAEKTLTALFKRGRCSTTELNRMTGGKPRLIKHRIDEWLAPAGLVKQCGTRPHSGNDVRVFKLTTEGQRYVSDQWSDLAHYARSEKRYSTPPEMNNEMGLVRDLSTRFGTTNLNSKNQSRLPKMRLRMSGNLKSEFGQLRDRVKELEKENEELREEIKSWVRGGRERGAVEEDEEKSRRGVGMDSRQLIDNVRNP